MSGITFAGARWSSHLSQLSRRTKLDPQDRHRGTYVPHASPDCCGVRPRSAPGLLPTESFSGALGTADCRFTSVCKALNQYFRNCYSERKPLGWSRAWSIMNATPRPSRPLLTCCILWPSTVLYLFPLLVIRLDFR